MKALRPRTVTQLTVIGFVAVAAPLIAALAVTLQQLNTLGGRSQMAVAEAAQQMRAARTLVEQTLAMERSARQYAVLDDRTLLEVFGERREHFIEAATLLQRRAVSDQVRNRVARLMVEEQRAFDRLRQARPGTTPMEGVLTDFPRLVDLADQVTLSVNDWIDRELIYLRQQADEAQRLILVEALALVAVALLLIVAFSILITRPLRQIDNAVHRLGDGHLDRPVIVRGPRDLEELGLRIEWLRRRMAELELQRVTFLRHVSHELKTPLTSIQEGIALLDERLLGPLTVQQEEISGILRKQCRRLQHLIEELLRFNIARPEAPDVRPRTVHLDSIAERVLSDHALAVRAGRLRVITTFEPVEVHGDPEQLRIVVDNLIANAVKFSPPGGTIEVQVSRAMGQAVLEVRDEGPGIPAEERALVFEAFYRGSPPQRRQFQGTGLGLAIASDYARLNGGGIDILDTERGARFRVHIPMPELERP